MELKQFNDKLIKFEQMANDVRQNASKVIDSSTINKKRINMDSVQLLKIKDNIYKDMLNEHVRGLSHNYRYHINQIFSNIKYDYMQYHENMI